LDSGAFLSTSSPWTASTLDGIDLGRYRPWTASTLDGIDLDRIARFVFAGQDLLRQRVFQPMLDGPFQRSGAVDRVEAGCAEQVERGIGDLKTDVAIGQAAFQVADLDAGDLADLFAVQWVEHDDFVDSVDEFGPELLADDFHDRRSSWMPSSSNFRSVQLSA